MLRSISLSADLMGKPLRRTAEGDKALQQYLKSATEDDLAARGEIDRVWTEALRQYGAVPRTKVKDVPIEGAPNIEVPLAATSADAIFAQLIETLFSANPILTCRAVQNDEERSKDAIALQRRVNLGVNEWGIRAAVDPAFLDTTQLGTGIITTFFETLSRKTDVVRIKERGPRPRAWPIEDVIVPGGSDSDPQRVERIGLRTWLSPGELAATAKRESWDIAGFSHTSGTSFVRSKREELGHSRSTARVSPIYEVIHWFVAFDYDNDGEDEDLLVVFDRTSGELGAVDYNPCDTRPIVRSVYLLRPYLFYGIGIMELGRAEQDVVTMLANEHIINVMLSNLRMWAVREGSPAADGDLTAYHNKTIPLANPSEDIKELRMGEMYPSIVQAIAQYVTMSERRLGVNEMSQPRPSQILGSRTPATTAVTMMQQVNRRFTPPFDNMRNAVAEVIRQCLYREQERLRGGDKEYETYLMDLLGPEDGQRVVSLLSDPRFDEQVLVEMTASSASANRDSDRQNIVMLSNFLGAYYQRLLQMAMTLSNPQLPEPVRVLAQKIAVAAGKLAERFAATIDPIRDPETFVIDLESELAAIQQGVDAQTMAQLAELLTTGGVPPAGSLAEPVLGQEGGGVGRSRFPN